MTAEQAGTDAEVLKSISSPDDGLWRDLFSMKLWTQGSGPVEADVDELGDLLYRLGLVADFDWPSWYSPGGIQAAAVWRPHPLPRLFG